MPTMRKLLVIAAVLLTTRTASGIKNSPVDAIGGSDASTGETSIALTGDLSSADQVEYGDRVIAGNNRDDRISRPDRNFIITHEGILNYQPVARSLHTLDQDYKASSTFSRSEVIPVRHSVAPSGRTLSDNSIAVVSGLSNRDAHAAYTSQDALSVPLHVGFQVEDAAPTARSIGGSLRMNPKGKVLAFEGELSDNKQYKRGVVARQLESKQSPLSYQMNDMNLAETSYVPSLVYGQRVESLADTAAPQSTKLTSIYHQPPSHQTDLAPSASNHHHYYRAIPANQNSLNPYFTQSNDLDDAGSDPRATFEVYQNQNGLNSSPNDNENTPTQLHKIAKDQNPDETKYYGDVNGGGARSYMDYMTAASMEKKFVGGRYVDVEDAGSDAPIHFGFQVEHPRLQYPAKSSFADKYHSDHHIPTKAGKIRIPKVPKVSKYVAPSTEDLDDEIDSDFKHIKVKKFSTNNEELNFPSHHSRYADDIPYQSRQNLKYASSPDGQQSTELLRSATNNQPLLYSPPSQRSNLNQHMGHGHMGQMSQGHAEQMSQQIFQGRMGQASQKYYQYVKPRRFARKADMWMYYV